MRGMIRKTSDCRDYAVDLSGGGVWLEIKGTHTLFYIHEHNDGVLISQFHRIQSAMDDPLDEVWFEHAKEGDGPYPFRP